MFLNIDSTFTERGDGEKDARGGGFQSLKKRFVFLFQKLYTSINEMDIIIN